MAWGTAAPPRSKGLEVQGAGNPWESEGGRVPTPLTSPPFSPHQSIPSQPPPAPLSPLPTLPPPPLHPLTTTPHPTPSPSHPPPIPTLPHPTKPHPTSPSLPQPMLLSGGQCPGMSGRPVRIRILMLPVAQVLHQWNWAKTPMSLHCKSRRGCRHMW